MEHLWTAAFEAHEIGKEGNGKACKDVNAEITDKKKNENIVSFYHYCKSGSNIIGINQLVLSSSRSHYDWFLEIFKHAWNWSHHSSSFFWITLLNI